MREPKIMTGSTEMVDTGCGHLYVSLSSNGNGYFKVTAELGKAGTCTKCQLEALSGSISLGLNGGVPLKEYISVLKGIRCPSPHLWPKEEESLSCADALGKALERLSEKESKSP